MKENYNKTRQNYNNTSSAYKLDSKKNYNLNKSQRVNKTDFNTTNFDSNYINQTVQRTRQIEQNKRIKQRQAKLARIKEQKRVKKERINHVLCYVLAFYLLGMGVICLQYSDKSYLVKQEVNAKRATVKEQNKEIEDLKVELSESVDIFQIEKYAKEELGMDKPAPNQIYKITLPKYSSYIEYEGS